jgi:hypothetical protein
MTNDTLPNKCEHCGLRVFYEFKSARETASSDKAFGDLRTLQTKRIIKPIYRRVVGASSDPNHFGDTQFCAVASPAFHKNDKSCSHWSLRIAGGSVGDYLSIYHDRRNFWLAKWAAISAAAITAVVALVQSGVSWPF